MIDTEIIPTKFPKNDVILMDTLIKKGMFISRSDLINCQKRLLLKDLLQKHNLEC